MKFIELTVIAEINQKALVNMDLVQCVLDCGDHSILGYGSNDGTLSVKETPKQIADFINGNQKESGWIENKLGEMPCDPNEIVAVVIEDEYEAGRACNFNWKLPPALVGYPITHYKIIGACPE